MNNKIEVIPNKKRSTTINRFPFQFIGEGNKSVCMLIRIDIEGEIEMIGTGFYITKGIVATAKHCFELGTIQKNDRFGVVQDGGDHFFFRAFEFEVKDTVLDLAICKLEPPHDSCRVCENHPIVGIMELDPIKNEPVAT